MKSIIMILTAAMLCGCASSSATDKPVQYQKVSIKVDTTCQRLRRLYPEHGLPTWATDDTEETIQGIIKLEKATSDCRKSTSKEKSKHSGAS